MSVLWVLLCRHGRVSGEETAVATDHDLTSVVDLVLGFVGGRIFGAALPQ